MLWQACSKESKRLHAYQKGCVQLFEASPCSWLLTLTKRLVCPDFFTLKIKKKSLITFLRNLFLNFIRKMLFLRVSFEITLNLTFKKKKLNTIVTTRFKRSFGSTSFWSTIFSSFHCKCKMWEGIYIYMITKQPYKCLKLKKSSYVESSRTLNLCFALTFSITWPLHL